MRGADLTATRPGVLAGPQLHPGRVLVACDRLHATLMLGACLARHAARWPTGNRAGRRRFWPCDRCELGAARLAEATWFAVPEASQPAEVVDQRQRLARFRWLRSFPEWTAPQALAPDPLIEAATLSPDEPLHADHSET